MKLFEKFNEMFENNLSNNYSREMSFDITQKQFELKYGWEGYKNIQSFKTVKSKNRKKNPVGK